jgi:hypothetical protein
MATFSDLDRFLTRFGTRIAKAKNRIETVALKDVQGRMLNRIFNRGLAANGSKIGSYSTKPILIGSSSFFKKSASNSLLGSKAKRRALNWVTINGKRLAVLPGGYKEVRSIQGRQASYVDLQLKGDLFRSIQVGKTNTGSNVLGFINDLSKAKADGNEDRFGKKIFALSSSEDKAINKAILRELDKILSNI